MAKVVVGRGNEQFVRVDQMKAGQAGFVIEGSTLGNVILRAKGDFAVDLSAGEVVNVSQTIVVFLIPSGTPITWETL